MQIWGINNQNFQGGFRFRSMPMEAKNKIPEISKKWKQVFYDFENAGDVFLVTRDNLDGKVAKFIRENNLMFEYYPQVSTKCGLDTEKPELLTNLLRELNTKPITTNTQMRKAINGKILNKRVIEGSQEYVDNILNTLCLKNPDLEPKIIKGMNVVDDKEFGRKIYISRPMKDKIHYVLIEPYSSSNPSERYALDSTGNFIKSYNTADEIKEFYSMFKKTVIK